MTNVKLTREELEKLALDKCPAAFVYDLRDDIDILDDADLWEIIDGKLIST